MESIHSAGFGSSVWKKLQETELKSSLSSVVSRAGSEETESPSDLESYIEALTLEPLKYKLSRPLRRPAAHVPFKVTVVKGRGRGSGRGLSRDYFTGRCVFHKDDGVHRHIAVVGVAPDGLDGEGTSDGDLGILPQLVALMGSVIQLPDNFLNAFNSQAMDSSLMLKQVSH